MKQLFQGGILVNGSGYRKADLLIENDKILDVGTGLSDPDASVIDVSGKYLFQDLLTRIRIWIWRCLLP